MYGANVIIFEGIMAFYNSDVLKVSNISSKLNINLRMLMRI